jgi:hypothetical protein
VDAVRSRALRRLATALLFAVLAPSSVLPLGAAAPARAESADDGAPWLRREQPVAFAGAGSFGRAERTAVRFDHVHRPRSTGCAGVSSPTSAHGVPGAPAAPGGEPVCGTARMRWLLAHATATAEP